MTQGQRHKLILEYLQSHEELVVEEACQLFDASPATIRRDFNELVSDGRALKTWGGIIKNYESSFINDKSLVVAPNANDPLEAQKRKIAEKAASFVQDGDVIIVDGGTTTFYMAPFLANKRIRVITNSIIIAYQIDKDKKEKQGAEVILTGGILYPESGLLVGPQANINIKQYKAKWAFLSCGALDNDGPSNSNQLVVETEQTIISQCEKTVLLADATKFGKRHMCQLCDWSSINYLITDAYEPDSLNKTLPVTILSV